MPTSSNTPLRPAPDDTARAMDALRRLVGALRSASRTSVRDLGVTGAQLFVLQQLATVPDLSVTQLAERTSTRHNSVSDVVRRLVHAGLVTRGSAPDDARRAVVSLTTAGRAIVRRAPPTTQAAIVAAFRALPAPSQRVLAGSLEAWVAAAGLADVPPTMFFERPSRRTTARATSVTARRPGR